MSKRKKLFLAIVLITSVSIAILLSLSKNQITYFYTVEEVLQDPQKFQEKSFRVMGFVEPNSVSWNHQDTTLKFSISEKKNQNLKVIFMGIKPDLFREGQGAVVEGIFKQNTFYANTLLVKHSEEYKVQDHNKKKEDYLNSIRP